MVDGTVQIVVATAELLLIVIIGKQPLVVGAHPHVLARILEDLCDETRGYGEGFEFLCQKVQFENAVL